MGQNKNNTNTDDDLLLDNDTDLEEPKMYKVIILNDDYTPMDFVIYVLKNIFGHNDKNAEKIMLDIHKKGAGLGGVYTFEVAETKSMQMNQMAKENQYPLKSYTEEDN